MAYLDCCEKAYKDYARRVEGADFRETFGYLCFHTPFGGMVKGAHRHLMRKLYKTPPPEIEADFQRRMAGSLAYGQRVGNTAGASVFLGLAGTLATGDFSNPQRIGFFSYGSGCCSEFYSGVATAEGQNRIRAMGIDAAMDSRHRLSIEEYERLLRGNAALRFGMRDAVPDRDIVPGAWQAYENRASGSQRLVLRAIEGYHRLYDWI